MDMLWSGWGDPARATPLPDTVIGLLRDLLGVKPRSAEPVGLADIAVPEGQLEPAAVPEGQSESPVWPEQRSLPQAPQPSSRTLASRTVTA